MWHTEYGDRVLKGAEAAVFATSALDMMLHGRLEDKVCAGIPVFDSLTYPQRIAVLHRVAMALFRPDVPMPELTAVLEGAVATVIHNISWLLEEEVENAPDDTSFRALVGQACRELTEGEEDIDWPEDSCDDMEEWNFCVEILHDGILWDTDYLGEENYVDLPPENAEALKQFMGVTPEYFSAIAPDPAPVQLEVLSEELELLCLEAYGKNRPRVSTRRPRRKPSGKRKAKKASTKGKVQKSAPKSAAKGKARTASAGGKAKKSSGKEKARKSSDKSRVEKTAGKRKSQKRVAKGRARK